jgi:hypothetical protein
MDPGSVSVVTERHGAEDDVSDRGLERIFGHDSKETSILQAIQQRETVLQQPSVVEFPAMALHPLSVE